MSGKNQLPDLDKIFREEDDDGFLPSGGSRLASIFGLSANKVTNNTITQQQTMPAKQSGQYNAAATQESKTEVIIAKAVHAFKLQNGQYVSIGKLGIALAGNASTRSYQLILYRSKQEHISVVSITPDFSYTVQANNYSTYYDTRKENWSILFENIMECIEFAREVGLSRYFSRREKSDSSLIYQDLNAPEKNITAKEGDKLTVKYIINTEIVQPLKSNATAELTMTVEISTDDNWERILLASTKNLRRLLILPPSKQISLGPGFPKDRDIVLQIEIVDIQSREEVKVPEIKPPGSSSKAAILSRMAKMGQSILPKTSISTTTDSEDTEDEVKKDRLVRHRKVESSESILSKKQLKSSQEPAESASNLHKVARSKHVLSSAVPSTQGSLIPLVYAPQWSPTQIQPQYVTMDGQTFSIAQQSVAQPMPAALDPSLNVLLAETRTQNTEIRMGMSKIADNIQKLLDKFHVLELQNASSPSSDRTMENTLKMILSMNASQIEMKNVPSLSAAEANPDIAEKRSDKLLQDQLRETVSVQEQDLKKMRELVNSTEQQLSKVKEEKRKLEEVNLELKENIRDLEMSFTTTKEDFHNLNFNHERTKDSLNDYQRRNSSLESEISQLRTDYKVLENANTKQRNLNSKNGKTKEIKLIMNKTYHSLLEQFTEESYLTSFIKETIAATLRDITLQVLKDEKSEEELSETTGFEMDKKDQQDSSERLSVSSDDIERRKDNNQSKLQSENTKLNAQTNVNEFVHLHIAPRFENEPPPIPPMDLSNETEWSDN